MTVVELDQSPSVVGLFARSLRPGGRPTDQLPDRELVLPDQRFDADHLAAYQRLCGFDVSAAVPATYLHIQAFPLAVALMAEPTFPFPLLGLVHVHNSMSQHRAVTADEVVQWRARAADLRDHPAGRQVDLRTEARVGDQMVWSGVSTYLRRGAPRPDGDRPRTHSATVPAVPSATWRLPADLGRRYGKLSGDRNPIHVTALAAKAFGFPRAIAHGMYLHARALAGVNMRLPAAYRVDAAFKTPALLPSTVAFECAPTADGWTLRITEARSGKPHFEATTAALSRDS